MVSRSSGGSRSIEKPVKSLSSSSSPCAGPEHRGGGTGSPKLYRRKPRIVCSRTASGALSSVAVFVNL